MFPLFGGSQYATRETVAAQLVGVIQERYNYKQRQAISDLNTDKQLPHKNKKEGLCFSSDYRSQTWCVCVEHRRQSGLPGVHELHGNLDMAICPSTVFS